MSTEREPEDAQLVEMARAAGRDDLGPFEELVRRHEVRVMTNCRYLTGSPDDAEDLTQEVFVKAFFGLPGFEGRAKFSTWIKKIKVNHCLNFLQKRARAGTAVDLEDATAAGADEMHVASRAEARVEQQGERRRIERVLDEMPDSLRAALVMRDLDGLSYQEIADQLQIGLSATKMRIKRGREEFRRRYGELQTTGAPS